MTGSSLPSRARGGQVDARTSPAPGRCPPGRGCVTRVDPRTGAKAACSASARRARIGQSIVLAGDVNRCQGDQQVLGRDVVVAERAGLLLRQVEHLRGGAATSSVPAPTRPTRPAASRPASSVALSMSATDAPTASSSGRVDVSGCASMAVSRCTGSTDGLPSRRGSAHCRAQRLLALGGEFLCIHGDESSDQLYVSCCVVSSKACL